jgi:hypothetical protein
MRARHCVAIIVVSAVMTASGPSLLATGYWNLPSTFCQCVGYGNGAGYHAPLVLGPIYCDGYFDSKEVRLPCPPRSPYSWYDCGADGCGCDSSNTLYEPTLVQP